MDLAAEEFFFSLSPSVLFICSIYRKKENFMAIL